MESHRKRDDYEQNTHFSSYTSEYPMLKQSVPSNTPSDPLQKGLTTILKEYVAARAHQTLDAGHYLWNTARDLKTHFDSSAPVTLRPSLIVRWSFGQGAWARIHWFALLDQRETKVTSAGIYVIYLFRQDMSGFYLTLNQGITKEKQLRGAKPGRDFVRERAISLRQLCNGLIRHGFSLRDAIDLRGDGALGLDYQLGTITHKLYTAANIPRDSALLDDLEHILQVYDTYLKTPKVF